MSQPTLIKEDDYAWDGVNEYDLIEEIEKTGNKGLIVLENNIRRRAARLWEEGYTFQPLEGVANSFHVITPTKTFAHRVYTYKTRKPICTCPCYRKWTYCKHSEAINAMMKQTAEIAAHKARQMMIEDAEHPVYGCDPHAEF